MISTEAFSVAARIHPFRRGAAAFAGPTSTDQYPIESAVYYWDYTTLLELTMLASDKFEADRQLDKLLGLVR